MKSKKPQNLDDFIGSGKADQHTNKTTKQQERQNIQLQYNK